MGLIFARDHKSELLFELNEARSVLVIGLTILISACDKLGVSEVPSVNGSGMILMLWQV